MKKSLLFGFAAAMTLASCTTNDEILGTAEQTAMEFSSFVNKSTKAPIDKDNITRSQFAVWGYKYKTTGTPATIVTVFDNVPVKYETSAWTYVSDTEKLRYWDKTCTYDFYAYAPSSVVAAISETSKGAATITVTDFLVSNTTTDYANHIDLMIADSIRGTTSYNTQQFTFRHKLTKVNMQIQKTETLKDDEVKLVSAKFEKVVNKATYTRTFAATATDNWSLSEQEDDKVDFSAVLTNLTESKITTSASKIFTDLLMIPQSITATQFVIEYTINNEPFSKTLNLASTWGINESYLYTLTIDANAIIFDAKVEDWTDKTNSNTNTTVKDQE